MHYGFAYLFRSFYCLFFSNDSNLWLHSCIQCYKQSHYISSTLSVKRNLRNETMPFAKLRSTLFLLWVMLWGMFIVEIAQPNFSLFICGFDLRSWKSSTLARMPKDLGKGRKRALSNPKYTAIWQYSRLAVGGRQSWQISQNMRLFNLYNFVNFKFYAKTLCIRCVVGFV